MNDELKAGSPRRKAGPETASLNKYVRSRFRKETQAPKRHGGGIAKGTKLGSHKHPDLELKLEIFMTIREPGREYTQAEIAEVCGCSRGLIWLIEKKAMQKLRTAYNKIIAREDD